MIFDLYKTLTARIDARYVDLKKNNPFYQSIFDGSIETDTFTRFLANTSFLTSHTPVHLKEAAFKAKKDGLQTLSGYFLAKAREEVDHEKWGEDDVKGISGKRIKASAQDNIHPAMQAMVQANLQMIKENPYHYFIYILFAEYYTVIAGPECMRAVELACGIPQKHMSIIGKHAELDKLHVQEWAVDSKALGTFGMSKAEHLAVLGRIMDRHDAFTMGLAVSKTRAA